MSSTPLPAASARAPAPASSPNRRASDVSLAPRIGTVEAIGTTAATAQGGRHRTPRPAGTFASLRVSNFRLYLAGQAVSVCGTWMQVIALGWLVLRLGASGTELGLVTAAQFVPMLLFGAYGGLIVDRADKRHLLIATQAASGCLALLLAALDLTGVVRLWMVAAVALGLGVVNAVDYPTRQSFVHELVGPKYVANAVTLSTVTINAARTVCPALAGVVVATAGTGVCFLVNGASFLPAVLAMLRMNPTKLTRRPPVAREKGQVRAGVSYVARTPALRVPILMMAIVGALTYEFPVSLPLFARETFSGTAATYGVMTAAMGFGAVAGGLLAARRSVRPVVVVGAAGAFGTTVLLTAASPTLPVALAALVTVGAASVVFMSSANASVQLATNPAMRGRVMALWSVAFVGSTPVGAPVVGFVAEVTGPRAGLALGGVAALVACGYGAAAASPRRRSSQTVRSDVLPAVPAVATAPAVGAMTGPAAATGRQGREAAGRKRSHRGAPAAAPPPAGPARW